MAFTMSEGYELDTDKIDDTVLGLFALMMCGGDRAWKGHDGDTLVRLFDKGMIYNPAGKAKSVSHTPERLERCHQHFDEMFVRKK